MKYTKTCECCGNMITAYSHNLNKPLVKALRQLVDYYETHRKPCNLQKHLNLSKDQYNNFQKLQYFRLVHRNNDGWVPTVDGTDFILGRIRVVTPAGTFGKEILENSHEAWDTHSTPRIFVDVKDIDEESWKQREDYKQEKTNTLF